MINKMYDIMSDLNEIIRDIDSVVTVAEIEFMGINEEIRNDVAKSVLNVHIQLLKNLQNDTRKLYNKIDTTIINIKHQ